MGAGLSTGIRAAETASGRVTPGDAALLRLPGRAGDTRGRLLDPIQRRLGRIQDDEAFQAAAVAIQPYTAALEVLDDEMDAYIHDNTDDEITHWNFLNAYLVCQGAAPSNLEPFRTLMGSTATGVNRNLIGKRLTNLTQLTLGHELVDPLPR